VAADAPPEVHHHPVPYLPLLRLLSHVKHTPGYLKA
jgi:hypothetical protein